MAKIGRPKLGEKRHCFVVCGNCKKEFKRTLQRAAERKNHYCSPVCYHQGRWGDSRNYLLNCTTCGKEFVRNYGQIKSRNKYGIFCSHPCYAKARSTLLVGENSPNWKGGYYLDYGGSNWKSQRRKALKRDNHTCQDCGATEQSHGYKMDVHHIVSYHRYKNKERANRLENLVTVCRGCHAKRHKKK